MEIKIRNAIDNDLKDIVEIYNQAILSRKVTCDTNIFNVDEKKEWFLEHSIDSYPIFVAEFRGKVVGWISLSPYRKGREALKKTVEVSYYIHNDFQRKGIGDKLLKEVLKTAKKIGYKVVFAILFDSNIGSIKLLEKNNFEKWGFLPDVIEIDDKTFSHLYYGKKI